MTTNSAAREKIAAKVRALQSHTTDRGCTEAEAMNAAGLAAKLIAEHDLSMTDVEISAELCEKEFIDTGSRVTKEITGCLNAIAHFTDTRVWIDSSHSTKRYVFFGLPIDTDFARYLYETIDAAMKAELAMYKTICWIDELPTGRRESHAFLVGMAKRIASRLRTMKKEQNANTLASTGRDLMIVKSNIVALQFAKLGLNLRRNSATTVTSLEAFRAGQAAGNKVGLNRPVGHSGSNGYLLGDK